MGIIDPTKVFRVGIQNAAAPNNQGSREVPKKNQGGAGMLHEAAAWLYGGMTSQRKHSALNDPKGRQRFRTLLGTKGARH